ncbi:MAG: TerD family protein [Candidatus Competibacter sp.]
MFAEERVLMLLEIYRYQGIWRVCAVGQSFQGNLETLVKYFNGTIENQVPGNLSSVAEPVTGQSQPLFNTHMDPLNAQSFVENTESVIEAALSAESVDKVLDSPGNQLAMTHESKSNSVTTVSKSSEILEAISTPSKETGYYFSH